MPRNSAPAYGPASDYHPATSADENLDILRDLHQTTPPPLAVILALAAMTLIILGALATLY